jgi:hypothetical protein
MDLFFCEKLQKKCVKRPVQSLPGVLDRTTPGTGLPLSAAGPRALRLSLSPRGHDYTDAFTESRFTPRGRDLRALSLSLFRHPPPLSGPAPPPPPYARWRGLRRSFHRRRALTRYSHPFYSLPAVRNRAPKP